MEDAGKITEVKRLSRKLERYQKDYAEFIEIAAHDLDAPLRKLGVWIEKIMAECGNEPGGRAQDYVKRVNTCLGDMRSMVDNLAMLSQLGLRNVDLVRFNPETVIREILGEMDDLVKAKNVSITIAGLPDIEGDIAQYRLLFKNLLQNAIRFSKKDVPPAIVIQAEAITDEEKERWLLEKDRPYYKISIADNGVGFRQEYAEKIFRPFVRLHGKSEYEGNGIGLALCRRIIDNHQGIIYADSDETTGARFILIIPQTTK